jgi:hypothetical protein
MRRTMTRLRQRLVARGVLGLLLLSLAESAAAQDLWEKTVRDSTPSSQFQKYENGAAYQGRTALPLPRPEGGGGTIGSVSSRTGKGCGAFDFASEFKAMFDSNAAESYIKGLGSAALTSAPLVLMCYASPTLCDAYKHFKSMASGMLSARAAECQAVENAAMEYGDKMAKRGEKQCIEEKQAAGVDLSRALDECKAAGTTLLGFDMKKVPNIKVVEDGLKAVGADQDTQDFAKSVLGEVSMGGSGSGGRSQNFRPMPKDGAERMWGEYYQACSDQQAALVEQVAAGVTPSEDDLRKISAPGLPVTRSVLQQMALLDPSRRALAGQRFCSALTLARLEHKYSELQAYLADAERLAASSNNANEEIKQQLQALEVQRARLRVLKEGQDNITGVLREIGQDAADQRAAAKARTPVSEGKGKDGVDLGGGVRMKAR